MVRIRRFPVSVAAASLVTVGLAWVGPPPATAADTCLGETVTLTATADNDVLTGTDGHDVISIGHFWGVQVDAGAGDDLVCVFGTDARVQGGDGEDRFYLDGDGSQLDDVLSGGAGDDQIEAYPLSGAVHGGAGNDALSTIVARSTPARVTTSFRSARRVGCGAVPETT